MRGARVFGLFVLLARLRRLGHWYARAVAAPLTEEEEAEWQPYSF